ncbi:MAG: oxidoreductase [Pseudomonadales bacterium]|nr:oxidoreductase [Pseudomonadales bacterium]
MNSSNKRTALIAGASGLVGGHCLQSLLNSPVYEKVIALSRQPLTLTHEKLECLIVDFEQIESETSHLVCDDVFCCLGTTIKKAGSQTNFRKVDFDYCLGLAMVGKRGRAEHFLLISAIGARAKSGIFYSRVKGELEQAIEELGFGRFSVFQPSLLAGERKDTRRAEAIGLKLTAKLSSLLVGPLSDYSVIEAKDLGAAMVSAAQAGVSHEVSGAQRLRYREIMKYL